MRIALMPGYSVYTGSIMEVQSKPVTGFEPDQLRSLATGGSPDFDRLYSKPSPPPAPKEPGKGSLIDLVA